MKIALLSFAHVHAAGYAAILRDLPGIEILASDPGYVDRPASETGGRAFAEHLGIDYVDSYDELFAWQPNAVVVCSENSHHRRDVERAAAAGAHVLCEKPLATSSVDGRAMIDACAAAGVTLMVAYPVRFSPAFRSLQERVSGGALGVVRSIVGTNNGRVPTDRSWFTDPALAGGGAITDHTVHVADMIDALLPEAKAERVYATGNRLLHPDLPVETAGLVTIEYSDGTAATIDCSWSKPAHYPVWGGLTMQVVGASGVAEIAPFAQRVDGFSESARSTRWLGYGTNADELLLAEFLEAIREGRPAEPSGETGLRTVAIVEAAYESVRTGAPARVQSR